MREYMEQAFNPSEVVDRTKRGVWLDVAQRHGIKVSESQRPYNTGQFDHEVPCDQVRLTFHLIDPDQWFTLTHEVNEPLN